MIQKKFSSATKGTIQIAANFQVLFLQKKLKIKQQSKSTAHTAKAQHSTAAKQSSAYHSTAQLHTAQHSSTQHSTEKHRTAWNAATARTPLPQTSSAEPVNIRFKEKWRTIRITFKSTMTMTKPAHRPHLPSRWNSPKCRLGHCHG